MLNVFDCTHTFLYLLCARETEEVVSRSRAPTTSSSGIIFPWLTVPATTTLPAFKLIIFIFFFFLLWGCYCICKCRFVYASGGGCQVASLAAASISISDFYLRQRLLSCRCTPEKIHPLTFSRFSFSFIHQLQQQQFCLPAYWISSALDALW